MKNSASAYWSLVATDFDTFLYQCFKTVYPNNKYLKNWHIQAIAHSLMETTRGARPRSIINLPPRNFKSFIVSVVWPAFLLARDPASKTICVSYNDELAKAISRDFLVIVRSEWYRRLFPSVALTGSNAFEVKCQRWRVPLRHVCGRNSHRTRGRCHHH